jgi:hypothetical protein
MEFIRASDVPMRPRWDPAGWGPWCLSRDYTLNMPGCPQSYYEIDLERFTSSAEMLDMIMQVAMKTWATDDVLAGLVRALSDTIDPQACLCSGGESKTLSSRQIRDRVDRMGSLLAGGAS